MHNPGRGRNGDSAGARIINLDRSAAVTLEEQRAIDSFSRRACLLLMLSGSAFCYATAYGLFALTFDLLLS